MPCVRRTGCRRRAGAENEAGAPPKDRPCSVLASTNESVRECETAAACATAVLRARHSDGKCTDIQQGRPRRTAPDYFACNREVIPTSAVHLHCVSFCGLRSRRGESNPCLQSDEPGVLPLHHYGPHDIECGRESSEEAVAQKERWVRTRGPDPS